MQLPRMRIGEIVDADNVRTNSGGTQALELWASHEVCESFGWTRARLKAARDTQAFPEPVAVVSKGAVAVWDAADCRAWWEENGKPSRAWRRAEAVRMYRRHGNASRVARDLKANRDSVVKWLRDAGEK